MSSTYNLPKTRPLRVYAFDPSRGRKLNNYMTIDVAYEKLEPGPVGRQLAVIDYDASNEVFYEPVDLDNAAVLIRNGLDPSESDPRFHQQMVYAVASETIARFEFALGRTVRWRRKTGWRGDNKFRSRLRIFPHAFQQANAFYDPDLRSVMFGYFAASRTDPGDALPGQTVYTCLSHDIVVHEMTHAILDGQRERLTDATGPDAAAFHEAFADLVALFQHFSNKEALLETINRTGGLIYRRKLGAEVPNADGQPAIIPELTEDNPLVELAKQFGQAIGTRQALRSAIGTRPNSHRLQEVAEPHERGGILVSAVFDAFFTIYVKRTRDLMRIARAGGTVSPEGDLHPDLANRLANEASTIAGRFANICIRAIDYLPPVDLQFGDFLRAIITADMDLVPDDPYGYRAELITAFRLRGIIPGDVTSFSEEALCWSVPPSNGPGAVGRCVDLEFETHRSRDWTPDEEQKEQQRRRGENARVLYDFAKKYTTALGLDPSIEKIWPAAFHPIHRISPSGHLTVNFVVEYVQQRIVPLEPGVDDSPTLAFRGGSTVIFDESGCVRYVIPKSMVQGEEESEARLAAQRSFHLERAYRSPRTSYRGMAVEQQLNFQLVHRGR